MDPDTGVELQEMKIAKNKEIVSLPTQTGTCSNDRQQSLRALNRRLQQEIHCLEEDRTNYIRQLRLEAIETGERAVELGLSAENLMALEEYAANLRAGQEPSIGRPSTADNAVLEKLMGTIEKMYVEMQQNRQQKQVLEVDLNRIQVEMEKTGEVRKEIEVLLRRRHFNSP